MTQAAMSSADQMQRVAKLLGKAAMRWRKEREISGIDSDSLPDRLEFRSVSSLSVTGRNDRVASQEVEGSVEAGSRFEMGDTNVVQRTTGEDRDDDRRSDSAEQSKRGQSRGREERSEQRRREGGQR